MTLADGRPQLVVAGRVAEILHISTSSARVTRCLEEGERYLGEVAQISADSFRATLSRGG